MQLNISQQMKQSMVIAPKMIQSMEILQMPLIALQEKVEQELADNVVLEREETESETASSETTATQETTAETNTEEAAPAEVEERELVVDNDQNNESDFERLLEMSTEWPEDNVSGSASISSNRVEDASDRQHDMMSNMESRPQSLHDHLLEQFSFFALPDPVRKFGQYLIHNLDGQGRLQSNLAEIVQVYGRPLSMEDAQYALQMIQKLEPRGVGARDVRETLLLQVEPDNLFHDELVTLITDHIEDIAHNRLPAIQRRTGYSLELIKETITELQKLNPYPGRGFEERPVQRVTPDMTVEKDENGKYVVSLVDEYVPHLRISRRYVEMLRQDPSQQTKDYIKKKVESAKWLIESIESRYTTLKKVAQAIVDYQHDFFELGPEHIVPLKMDQIAEVVGVHVTTVSRAVDDKWILSPRGLYPLKRFFGGGTTTADGDEVAWELIRRKLQEVIDSENKSKPLSDEAIVKELSKHGFKLARRTVTKYRDRLNIPKARERKIY